jgi:membrane-bound lytic murein transglycosylase A
MAALPGWSAEDHAAALAAIKTACGSHPNAAHAPTCGIVAGQRALGEADARRFLEMHFRPEPVAAAGRLTAYFSPVYEARRSRSGEFDAAVRPPPAPAVDPGTRAEIETDPPVGALAWMRPEDLYFLQTQGSGVLAFPDGARSRAVFAGANGRAYVAIAGPLAAKGLIPASRASASVVHGWLAAHRGAEADAAMRLNPRYVFFRLEPDDGGDPKGAAGAPLIAGRSLAVDPTFHAYYEVFWIDAGEPRIVGARSAYQRLAIALDRGSAITGEARADLYVGQGPAAANEAGNVNHSLRLYRLVPVADPGR